MKSNTFRRFGVAAAVLFAAATLAGCDKDIAAPSDQTICAFDGDQGAGQKLMFQIPSGGESKSADPGKDEIVGIPVSERFWTASENDQVRDAGAPMFYTGNAGNTEVYVTGQIPFKFNEELACEWFSKFGRRRVPDTWERKEKVRVQDPLGFNKVGDAEQGWFLFLNQYFSQIMQQQVSKTTFPFRWEALHYNYPVNVDDSTGETKQGDEPGIPSRQKLEEQLSVEFDAALEKRLGARYFCGTEGITDKDPCPQITFQITYAGPNKGASAEGENVSALVKERQAIETARAKSETAEAKAQLDAQNQDAALKAEKTAQALLVEEAKTAQQQAQVDTAKCQILAPFGLDCEGNHAPVVSGGQIVNQSVPKGDG